MRRAQPWKTNRARALRANATSAEAKLWEELRNRRLSGLKFVRQTAIDRYFVDFVCRERRIIIEVDGGTHSTREEVDADQLRNNQLQRLGFRIFRTSNSDIYDHLGDVIDALLAFVDADEADT